MIKIAALLALLILWGGSYAGATETDVSGTYWDWLGVGPIFGYGSFFSPYYPYYTYSSPADYAPPYYSPTYSYSWPYAQPYYYYQPYSISSHPSPWWIGTHGDLPKALDIARSGSSIRIYSNGIWRTV
jgi:hypothetical protein